MVRCPKLSGRIQVLTKEQIPVVQSGLDLERKGLVEQLKFGQQVLATIENQILTASCTVHEVWLVYLGKPPLWCLDRRPEWRRLRFLQRGLPRRLEA
jgi:hypothetical protein